MTISTFCWIQVQLTQLGEIPALPPHTSPVPSKSFLKGRCYADVITPDPDIDNASELERAEAALINHQPVRIASIDCSCA